MNGSGTDWGWVIAGLALAWNAVNSLWTRYVAGQAVARKEIEVLKGDLGDTRRNIASIEARLDTLPSKEMVHGIELSVKEMQGTLKAFGETIRPIGRSVERIEEWLMKKGREA
jgi:hypothetical protein